MAVINLSKDMAVMRPNLLAKRLYFFTQLKAYAHPSWSISELKKTEQDRPFDIDYFINSYLKNADLNKPVPFECDQNTFTYCVDWQKISRLAEAIGVLIVLNEGKKALLKSEENSHMTSLLNVDEILFLNKEEHQTLLNEAVFLWSAENGLKGLDDYFAMIFYELKEINTEFNLTEKENIHYQLGQSILLSIYLLQDLNKETYLNLLLTFDLLRDKKIKNLIHSLDSEFSEMIKKSLYFFINRVWRWGGRHCFW